MGRPLGLLRGLGGIGPVPSCVLEEFPDLTQDEWDAVLQVTGLTLLAFEGESASEEG
ncbi:hypothetical protein [Streptomyces sp. NPDC058989]|uniref:hypothetical protein n=1 Tax=Streptomyces sp. NPDC058989 TaxID=3346686 RepID=UPI00368015EB